MKQNGSSRMYIDCNSLYEIFRGSEFDAVFYREFQISEEYLLEGFDKFGKMEVSSISDTV
jgi:hypothetical protein